MVRRQIYLTEREVEDLHEVSKELGLSVSEYIRRILDSHLKVVGLKKPIRPIKKRA